VCEVGKGVSRGKGLGKGLGQGGAGLWRSSGPSTCPPRTPSSRLMMDGEFWGRGQGVLLFLVGGGVIAVRGCSV
jgi:hypothetical protein